MMQADELKALRAGLGLSRQALGEMLGLTPVFIGMMERGEKPIERRTEMAARYVQLLANSNTVVALALRLQQAARGEIQPDRDDLAQAAEWLLEGASLPRDW